MTSDDEALLRRTLELAERGRRGARPNPVVGCVIARAGALLGEGWHVRYGERHAETIALAACTLDPRGATAYVSLEPCNHQGRQPPCSEALIAAGIARVVVAAGDPSARVAGAGIARLREAGIEVDLAGGEIERDARRQNAPFRVHAVDGRPFVLLKFAASLDGKIATRDGETKWISSPDSRRLVHEWRATMDAVAVGSGTALEDDPDLRARDCDPPAERQPLRVVFDRRGRLPAASALARSAGAAPVVRIAPASARHPPPGVERLDADDASAALQALGARGIQSMLLEGGGGLAAGLIGAGLVDAIAFFAAPLLIGGDDAPGLLASGAGRLADASRLHDLRVRAVGPDLLLEAELRELP
jgi:diaminohydroxyphosphoribosylaminopyrimidine deaminase / 5-amino-6-(5-phosphoribosylamino)uracil reductase